MKTYDGGSGGTEQAMAKGTDGAGNIYVTGSSSTVKYGSDGKKLWIASTRGVALAADSSGNVYLAGGALLNFTTAKLDSHGHELWRTRYQGTEGSDNDNAVALAVDSGGNVIVTGLIVWGLALTGRNTVPMTL